MSLLPIIAPPRALQLQAEPSRFETNYGENFGYGPREAHDREAVALRARKP